MMSSLQACVHWADRKLFIYLTVDVVNCINPNIQVEKNSFLMTTSTNENTYEVSFPFFLSVVSEVI